MASADLSAKSTLNSVGVRKDVIAIAFRHIHLGPSS